MSEEQGSDRKIWIENRLQTLAQSFAIGVGGFSIMDNHLHVLCRIDSDLAESWSAEEVVRRWIAIYPPGLLDLNDSKLVNSVVKKLVKDVEQVEVWRSRLGDLGWFMKALKEPLSRKCNKEDGVKGTFWEARYKSIAILDDEALLATCAYIDLNPVAAGVSRIPEQSGYTSFKQRVDHVRERGKLRELKLAAEGDVKCRRALGDVEQSHWLVPIDNPGEVRKESRMLKREGMLETFSLGGYVMLVEYTGRMYRKGKAQIDAGVADVLTRLGTSVEYWQQRMKLLLGSGGLRGSFFGCREGSVDRVKQHRGKRTANLTPVPAVG